MKGFEFLAQPGFSPLSLVPWVLQPGLLEGSDKEPTHTGLRGGKNWLAYENKYPKKGESGMAGSRSLSHVL